MRVTRRHDFEIDTAVANAQSPKREKSGIDVRVAVAGHKVVLGNKIGKKTLEPKIRHTREVRAQHEPRVQGANTYRCAPDRDLIFNRGLWGKPAAVVSILLTLDRRTCELRYILLKEDLSELPDDPRSLGRRVQSNQRI